MQVHIWDKDIHFDLNQEWSVKNMSIVSNDGRCLKVSEAWFSQNC